MEEFAKLKKSGLVIAYQVLYLLPGIKRGEQDDWETQPLTVALGFCRLLGLG